MVAAIYFLHIRHIEIVKVYLTDFVNNTKIKNNNANKYSLKLKVKKMNVSKAAKKRKIKILDEQSVIRLIAYWYVIGGALALVPLTAPTEVSSLIRSTT